VNTGLSDTPWLLYNALYRFLGPHFHRTASCCGSTSRPISFRVFFWSCDIQTPPLRIKSLRPFQIASVRAKPFSSLRSSVLGFATRISSGALLLLPCLLDVKTSQSRAPRPPPRYAEIITKLKTRIFLCVRLVLPIPGVPEIRACNDTSRCLCLPLFKWVCSHRGPSVLPSFICSF